MRSVVQGSILSSNLINIVLDVLTKEVQKTSPTLIHINGLYNFD